MDRINFSGSIDVDPVMQVRYYFNEVMAMYDFVEGLNYNLIQGFINDENLIQFTVQFNTPEEAKTASTKILNNTNVLLYNKKFNINGSVSGSKLLLVFRQL